MDYAPSGIILEPASLFLGFEKSSVIKLLLVVSRGLYCTLFLRELPSLSMRVSDVCVDMVPRESMCRRRSSEIYTFTLGSSLDNR